MKRSPTIARFGPVALTSRDIAERLTTHIVTTLDGHLYDDFARLEFDEDEQEYDVIWEDRKVAGRDHLLERVRDEDARGLHTGWMCSYRMPFQFANGDVRLGVWREPDGAGVMMEIDPAITRFTEEYPETRPGLVKGLMQVAQAIESPWFTAGVEQPWVTMTRERLLSVEVGRRVLGWKDGALDHAEVTAALGLDEGAIKGVLPGYWFVFLFRSP